MRILMLNFEFPPIGGGTANANYYFLKEASNIKDLQIDLVTSKVGRGLIIEDFSKNIRIYKIGIKKKDLHHWKFSEMLEWCLKAHFLIRKLLKKSNYDLMHCWFGWPCGFFGYISRGKIPYMIALRGHDVPGYEMRFKKLESLFLRSLSRKVWKKASKLTANSKGLAELAKETINKEILIIPNGVDTNEFVSLKNKKTNKKITLISTGRLGQRKGHIYLIRALKKISGFKIILVGQGSEINKLKKESQGLDIEFKGFVNHNELQKVLSKADIYISTSLVEGMSNSILEAMACGLPIITTNVGGTSELIKGNGTIINKTQDVGSIIESLKLYKKNSKLIKMQGNISRQIAETMSWKNVVDRYVKEVYV